MMQLQAIERKQSADDQINWVTTFFMVAFHLGAVAALFFFTWKALFVRFSCGGYRKA
jgi:sn-1 stearoyl-lipid 9-desaturase